MVQLSERPGTKKSPAYNRSLSMKLTRCTMLKIAS